LIKFHFNVDGFVKSQAPPLKPNTLNAGRVVRKATTLPRQVINRSLKTELGSFWTGLIH